MKKRFNKLNLIYLLLWIIPFYIFGRDFFKFKGIENSTINVILFTIYQAFISSIFAFLIAIFPSYYVASNNNKISKLIRTTLFIPFLFPVVSAITAFSIIGNFSILKKINFLYSLKAIIVANVFYNTPIFIKYISIALQRIPKNLEETLEIEGVKGIKKFIYIDLPLILPSIFRAFFLVFTYCFTSLGIVLGLGGIKYSILEVEIATIMMSSLDFSKAFLLGIIQFVILSFINIINNIIPHYELEKSELKKYKINIFGKIIVIIFLILEYFVLIISFLFSVYNFYDNRFTIRGIKNLFSKEFNLDYRVIEAFKNTILIAIITAVIVIIFTYIFIKNENKYSNFILMATFGISNAFIAIALIYLNILYNIPYLILLIIGFFYITVPLAYSFLHHPIKTIKNEIIEAAKIDGVNIFNLFFKIEFPILKNSFISVFIQIFAIIFGEFSLVYTMQISDYFPVISVVNYSLSSDKKIFESMALSSIVLLIIFILFYFSEKLSEE
ncbi:MAG: thiamine transport system permease protein [Fusobacteriaceae bacterium]|jgi:thiamine transport system permease protein|nr:binding-protein-dependent transport system inner rane component [Fusobacteriales bacterium]MDN5303235.1 thiamine transport system permease protein [Fusobacteriaceae bacterium]